MSGKGRNTGQTTKAMRVNLNLCWNGLQSFDKFCYPDIQYRMIPVLLLYTGAAHQPVLQAGLPVVIFTATYTGNDKRMNHVDAPVSISLDDYFALLALTIWSKTPPFSKWAFCT